MTHLYNDPAEFKNEVIKGFAAAYPQYVQRVEGASGFVRAGGPLEGKVSLVIGGGSGHYPSYNGVVGTGFADGAVLGDLFASPSAEQVYRGQSGRRRRRSDPVRQLRRRQTQLRGRRRAPDQRRNRHPDRVCDRRRRLGQSGGQQKRRGIAGTFTVYKMAAAAAENGANPMRSSA